MNQTPMTITERFLLKRLLTNPVLMPKHIDGKDAFHVKFASESEEAVVAELIKRNADAHEYAKSFLKTFINNFDEIVIDRLPGRICIDSENSVPRVEILLISD